MKSTTNLTKKQQMSLGTSLFKVLIPAGIAAGFLNGLLGAGAGIVLVFLYSAIFKNRKESTRDVFAMTVATVIPISLYSVFRYSSTLDADFSKSLIFLLPGAAGGIAGAFITDKISTVHLRLIFSALTVIAGINMLFR